MRYTFVMRQAFSRPFSRAYHNIHGARPGDDIDLVVDLSGFRRTDAGRGPVIRSLREWFRAATPVQRFARVWWWCVCAVLGLACGIVATFVSGAVFLLV